MIDSRVLGSLLRRERGGGLNFNCHVFFSRNSLATVVGRYMLRLGSTSYHSNAADAVHYAAAGLTSEEHISRNGNLGFVYSLPTSSSSSSSFEPLHRILGRRGRARTPAGFRGCRLTLQSARNTCGFLIVWVRFDGSMHVTAR